MGEWGGGGGTIKSLLAAAMKYILLINHDKITPLDRRCRRRGGD